MTKPFKFRSNILHIDIAGNKFEIKMGNEIADRMGRFGVEAQIKAKTLDDTPEGREATWKFCADTIDEILGTGASNTIFGMREHNIFDILDVIRYITGEIEAFNKGVR